MSASLSTSHSAPAPYGFQEGEHIFDIVHMFTKNIPDELKRIYEKSAKEEQQLSVFCDVRFPIEVQHQVC